MSNILGNLYHLFYIIFLQKLLIVFIPDDSDRPPLYQPPSERKDSLSPDKPQPILGKKKTSLLDKKRVSSAKVCTHL